MARESWQRETRFWNAHTDAKAAVSKRSDLSHARAATSTMQRSICRSQTRSGQCPPSIHLCTARLAMVLSSHSLAITDMAAFDIQTRPAVSLVLVVAALRSRPRALTISSH